MIKSIKWVVNWCFSHHQSTQIIMSTESLIYVQKEALWSNHLRQERSPLIAFQLMKSTWVVKSSNHHECRFFPFCLDQCRLIKFKSIKSTWAFKSTSLVRSKHSNHHEYCNPHFRRERIHLIKIKFITSTWVMKSIG